eukprot:5348692-Lingulodinium_polyedra.AAC.1
MHVRYSRPTCRVVPLKSCDFWRLSPETGVDGSERRGIWRVAATSGPGGRAGLGGSAPSGG